jgi:hypothetical protein
MIAHGAHRVKMADLLDERGSLRVDRVEWRATDHDEETKINGVILAVRVGSSGGPTPTWSGYIGGTFAGVQADNAADVKGMLLQRAAFE